MYRVSTHYFAHPCYLIFELYFLFHGIECHFGNLFAFYHTWGNITLLVSKTIPYLTKHHLESVWHTNLHAGLSKLTEFDSVLFAPKLWIVSIYRLEMTTFSKTRSQKNCFDMFRVSHRSNVISTST